MSKSKSVLPIVVTEMNGLFSQNPRTIDVPCRLPEAFNFKFAGKAYTAGIRGGIDSPVVEYVECDGDTQPTELEEVNACAIARSILFSAKGALGLTTASGVPTVDIVGSPLKSIALAYEAECAAYDACVKAHSALPRTITGEAMYWSDPREGHSSAACRMLAKHVEHVFEHAAKAHEVKP